MLCTCAREVGKFLTINLSGNYATTESFQPRTTLNGMDFKFVSHRLWSKKQIILRQYKHKKESWILTNKCENNVKHENKAEGPGLVSLVFVFKIISTFIGQNPKFFFMHVLKKHVLLL